MWTFINVLFGSNVMLHLTCLLVAQPSHFKNDVMSVSFTVCTFYSASWQRQSCDSLSTENLRNRTDLALDWILFPAGTLYSLVSVYFYKTLHVNGEGLHEQTCDVTLYLVCLNLLPLSHRSSNANILRKDSPSRRKELNQCLTLWGLHNLSDQSQMIELSK